MMSFDSQNDFNRTLNEALEGKRSAQGRIKDAIFNASGTTAKEAITSDQLRDWMTAAVAPAFEKHYAEQPQTWTKFATEERLNDFRPTQLQVLDQDFDATLLRDNGGVVAPAGTLPAIAELTPYPTFGYKASGRWIDVAKHGARIQFSWEAFINDDWGTIESFPAHAAELAARTIDAGVYGLIWSLNPAQPGFNTSNINDANNTVLKARTADGTLITSNVPKNAPLSYDSIKAAIQQVAESKVDGRNVMVPRFVLVVPPALEQVAKMVINTRHVEHTVPGSKPNTSDKFLVENGLASSVEVVVSTLPYTLGGTNGQTNWALLPAGGKTSAKRTLVRTTLRGHEKPELRVSNVTGSYLGGGAVPYTEGSFDNDDAQARVRLVTGAGALNLDGIVCSTGAGS